MSERRPGQGSGAKRTGKPTGGAGGTHARGTRGGGGRQDRDTGRVEKGPGAYRADRRDDGRPRKTIPSAPEPADDATLDELDRATRAQLKTLPVDLADTVGRHLVMVGRLLEEDPEAAYLHAAKAQALASRVGAVREVMGLAAYRTGRWAQALSELRAARRMGGHEDLLPLIADCERALGRPERALALAGDPAVSRLDEAGRVEMLIVAAGARRDMGQVGAAVLALQVKELTPRAVRPWTARLRFAYADALLEAGREPEARTWFSRAVDADSEGETDAAERLAALDGLVFDDALSEDGAADQQGDDRSGA
jgi:tetratricopeptide (TPR) repeat protein